MAKLALGIVGLPNVGKSTLFNALLKKQAAYVANYPFATIEPNVGVVEVPDERLPVLAKIVETNKIVPATVEFYDIAGLVKGASQGEGLGNKFLSHIREVAAIVHVVRLFESSDITHVANRVDPLSDIKIIDEELALADLQTLEKQREPRGGASKDEIKLYEVVKKVQEVLNKGLPVREMSLEDEEKELLKQLNLLTSKPVIFVFNVSEEQLEKKDETEKKIKEILSKGENYLYLNAKLENDVLNLAQEDQREYLQTFGLEETGLNRLIKESYRILNLISFLTAGELEARAWTIQNGSQAVEAAGEIHTDFMKKFVKADVVSFDDFVAANGWTGARDQGKVRIVGRDYIVQDGEVIEFKISA